jgi:beta-glucanase (GH16 family)
MTYVNGNVWNVETVNAGHFNGELESYSPNNVWSDGRRVRLDAHYNGGPVNATGSYTSGRMNTKNKAVFDNGAWSASFHYYQDNGANHGGWPALWLLGNGISEDQWTSNATCTSECGCGVSNWPMNANGNPAREIDFGEWMNSNSFFNGGYPQHQGYTSNAIYGWNCQQAGDMLTNHTGNPNSTFDPNNWAIFKVQYDIGVGGGGPQIKFFNNGNFQQQWGMDAFYNQPYFMIINLAIGGAGGGDASGFNNTGQWASVQIDWVAHEKWCTAAQMNSGSC